MKNDNDVLLKVDHLCQYFKMGNKELKAVDDVSFEVRKGEVFGLVGESGCGKTTTGRSIIRLYDITGGNVWFEGVRTSAGTRSYKDAIAKKRAETAEKIKALKAKAKDDPSAAEGVKAEIAAAETEAAKFIADRKVAMAEAVGEAKRCDSDYAARLSADLEKEYSEKFAAAEGDEQALKILRKEYAVKKRVAKRSKLTTRIQMIFQDPIASLDPRMTVREIIAEGLIINGVRDKEEIDRKVYDILETVGLVREHAGRYPHEFSGGQRQRIGIARAVVMNPDMIIADEPVSALDVSIQAQVINLLNDLRDKLGLTILFIAHNLSVVKYFSDKIGVMYFGKMVELAESDELFRHPLHPYTKSLLSAIPLPDPKSEKERVRIVYNPIAEHDYSVDKPTMREITEGHFVYCNAAEEAKYRDEITKQP